jgi:hypothetical protein
MRHRYDSEDEMELFAAIACSLGIMSSIVVAGIIDGHPKPRV